MKMTRENQINAIEEGILKMGISQHRLEILAGIPVGTIKDLKRGKRAMVADRWQKIQEIIADKKTAQDDELRDSEIALTDAIKDIIQVLLHHGLATPDSLNRAFTYQHEHYREKNLPNAMAVMTELRSYVTGEPREPEREIVRRLLQLVPVGSA